MNTQYRRTTLEIFSPLISFLLLSHRSRSQVSGYSSGHDTGCSTITHRSYRSQETYFDGKFYPNYNRIQFSSGRAFYDTSSDLKIRSA